MTRAILFCIILVELSCCGSSNDSIENYDNTNSYIDIETDTQLVEKYVSDDDFVLQSSESILNQNIGEGAVNYEFKIVKKDDYNR